MSNTVKLTKDNYARLVDYLKFTGSSVSQYPYVCLKRKNNEWNVVATDGKILVRDIVPASVLPITGDLWYYTAKSCHKASYTITFLNFDEISNFVSDEAIEGVCQRILGEPQATIVIVDSNKVMSNLFNIAIRLDKDVVLTIFRKDYFGIESPPDVDSREVGVKYCLNLTKWENYITIKISPKYKQSFNEYILNAHHLAKVGMPCGWMEIDFFDEHTPARIRNGAYKLILTMPCRRV